PGDKSTEDVTTHVTLMARRREQALRDHLEPVLGEYDAVLFDCAPSRNILHRAAIAVADWLIIPTQLSTLDVHGVRLIIEMVREVRADLPGSRVQLAGILPTLYERRTKETVEVWRQLSKLYPEHIWAPIPQDVRVREAPAYSRTLWEYAPDTNAVIGFEVRNGGGERVGGYTTVLENMLNLMP
ncbi:MAG: ParA family protein, partial [Anaerolineales bacterium]